MFQRWPILVFGLIGFLMLGLAFGFGWMRTEQGNAVREAATLLEDRDLDWARVEGGRGVLVLSGQAPDREQQRAARALVSGVEWVDSVRDLTVVAAAPPEPDAPEPPAPEPPIPQPPEPEQQPDPPGDALADAQGEPPAPRAAPEAPVVEAPVPEPVVVEPLVIEPPAPLALTVLKDLTTLTLTGSVAPGLAEDLVDAGGPATLDVLSEDAVEAPRGWARRAVAIIAAVAEMETGVARLDATSGEVSGFAGSAALRERLVTVLDRAAQDWPLTYEIDAPAPVERDYVFTAATGPDGARAEGLAPDRAVAARLEAAAERLGAAASITLIDGMPDEGWPEAAENALEALYHLETGEVTLHNRSVGLSGVAAGPASAAAARSALEGLPEGYEASVTIETATAVVSPYRMRAWTEGNVIRTEGAATQETLDALTALAGVAAGVEVARGVPDGDWEDAVIALVPMLARLERGSLTVEDRAFVLEGADRDPEAAAAAFAAAVPQGYTLETDLVTMAPTGAHGARFSRDADGAILLSGVAPDDTFHMVVSGYAKAVFGAGAVTDAMRVDAPEAGPGAETLSNPDWPAAASVALDVLGIVQEGFATLSRGLLRVEGAGLADQVDTARKTLENALPTGYRVLMDFSVVEPEEEEDTISLSDCETLFNIVAARDGLVFEGGGAALLPESDDVVIQLAAMAQACGDGIIEVIGHADGRGGDGDDLRLSAERAKTVRDAMAAAGAEPARLRSRGQGNARPVTDENGRLRANRIEFKVFDPN